MAELLLELLSEEIPARMQKGAAGELKRLIAVRLKDAGLEFAKVDAYAGPRRLTLVVDGLPEKQPDRREERKGPRVGAPEKAIEGFLKSAGLSSIEEAEVRDTDKGRVYFAVKEVTGQATSGVLPGLIEDLVRSFPWPKSMRWNGEAVKWVRPLRGVLALLNGMTLSVKVGLESEVANSHCTTRGHPFRAPGEIEVSSFADYVAKLEKAYVVVDAEERKRRILEQARKLAGKEGLTLKEDPGLLEEVTGLVEWPVVLMGRIDKAFMDLPPEVLTTSMRTHQKYFALHDKDGRLANRFLLVSNMEAPEGSEIRKNIIVGNERVLKARLADAKFFWDQDRKITLASRAPALEAIVFHAKLGTLDQKIDRVEALAAEIAKHVPGAERALAARAARLAKADLTSGMVGEFPELQGIMGRYYALADGEDPAVAEAIAEHYSPLGPNDRCPSAPVSVAIALADKIDTLVGFWAIDEKPTGSKDPFALRRAALGVIRLIVENGLRVPLGEIFASARSGLGKTSSGFAYADLLAFFEDRLKVALKDKGVRHDLIDACFAVEKPGGGAEDDLVRLLARVDALHGFLASDDGANLLTAYRRAANIVRIEEKKDGVRYDGGVDEAAFAEEQERRLMATLQGAQVAAAKAFAEEDFMAAMAALARLRQPVDAFFDEVTVNAPEPKLRANRLRLLNAIGATLGEVADFSLIEG